MGTLRITTGRFKNRRLPVPKKGVRPTSERVREAIFSALGARIDGARVLDAFAGTGALGIEALSRGAASVRFVERASKTARTLEQTMATLNIGSVAALSIGDGVAFVRREHEAQPGAYDVVFADPPYALKLNDFVTHALGCLSEDGVLVLERDRRTLDALPAAAPVLFDRVYGDSRIVMLLAPPKPVGGERGIDNATPPPGARDEPMDETRSTLMSTPQNSRAAIYAGSFDPLTNGHIDIVKRGLKSFDRVVLAIANNPNKSHTFDVEQRIAMAHEATADLEGVDVDTFDGLLVNYATEKNIGVLLRGLRAVSDFEYEFQLATMNRNLAHHVETMFMMTSEEWFYLSSRLVREVARFSGDVSSMVPACVNRALTEKYGPAGKKTSGDA